MSGREVRSSSPPAMGERELYEAPKLSLMRSRDVFCPGCGAKAGESCKSATGKRVHGTHAAREDAFLGLVGGVTKKASA